MNCKLLQIQWAPANTKQILALTDSHNLKLVNIDTCVIEHITLVNNISAVKWHPRNASKILVGTDRGEIYLYNLDN